METIRALAHEIGPRPSCSPAEERAAEWCAANLSEMGYDVAIEEFESRLGYYTWYAGFFALSLVAALLIVPVPAASIVLGLAGLLLYARDSDGRPLIKPRGGRSRNVVARPARTDGPEIIVVAHLDSARSSPSFHPKMVNNFHTSVVTLNLALATVPVLGAAAWIAEAGDSVPTGLWIPAVVLAAYLAFAIGMLLYGQFRMSDVPGANDNASGVAVLMRLARMDWDGRAWFVVTGSEEVGMVGAQAFLDSHRSEVTSARILNIDNVGAGRLIAITSEGVLRERRADPVMVEVAARAGASDEPFKGLPTDATTFLAARARAMTLLAVNDHGVPPNWHWRTDTIDNVDPEALDRATAAARAVMEAIVLKGTYR